MKHWSVLVRYIPVRSTNQSYVDFSFDLLMTPQGDQEIFSKAPTLQNGNCGEHCSSIQHVSFQFIPALMKWEVELWPRS